MATTLYGWTWVGDDEPTEYVEATQEWISPATGNKYRRNTSNTAWTFDGNINSRLSGAVEVAGSTMAGPLLDAPNLPPKDDPDFTGTIRQGGSPVALETSLAALERRLYDRIGYLVRQQFLSNTKRSGTAANIAYDSGVAKPSRDTLFNVGYTVPLPVFESDGVTATEDQVLGYSLSLHGAMWYVGAAEKDYGMVLYESPEGSRTFKVAWLSAETVQNNIEIPVAYTILAVR